MRSTCASIAAASSDCPAAAASAASCDRTASGVLRPCARSPAFDMRAADRAFPVIEVGVQLVHHRLDLDGVGAARSAARCRCGPPRARRAAGRTSRGRGAPGSGRTARQPTAPMKSIVLWAISMSCGARKKRMPVTMCESASSPIVQRTAPNRTRKRSGSRRHAPVPTRYPRPRTVSMQRAAELAPEPRDEDLDRVRVAVERLRVDVLGQLALRDDPAALVHQVGRARGTRGW